jgi:hypothetical protein
MLNDFISITLAIVGGFVLGFLISVSVHGTYKEGQIDCINNVIKYELVKQEDGSTKWQEIIRK